MFSYPVNIPLIGNRFLVGNVDSAISDIRPVQLEHTPMRILVDGLPFRSGLLSLPMDDEVEDGVSMNIASSSQVSIALSGICLAKTYP